MKKHVVIYITIILTLYGILNYFYYIHGNKKIIEESKAMNLYSFVPNMKHNYDEYFGLYTRYSYIDDFKYLQKINYSFDRLGYRNYKYDENISYDTVIFGDSFFWGCSNDDKYTMSNYIVDHSDINSYSFARNGFLQVPMVVQSGFLEHHKTKIIILEMLEEYISDATIRSFSNKLLSLKKEDPYNFNELIIKNKVRVKESSGALSISNIKATYNMILYRISEVLFSKYSFSNIQVYQTKDAIFTRSDGEYTLLINRTNLESVQKRRSYKKITRELKIISDYFQRKNIKFIFIPVPNSLLMYSNNIVALNLPDNHVRLIQELKNSGVVHLDALEILKKSKKKDLWLYDDPHWSPKAIKIIGDELIKLQKRELKK